MVNQVHTGDADLCIIQGVDAINSGQVRISDEAPIGTYVPIHFGQAVVWTCQATSRLVAEQFSNFMMSPRIQKLCIAPGFLDKCSSSFESLSEETDEHRFPPYPSSGRSAIVVPRAIVCVDF